MQPWRHLRLVLQARAAASAHSSLISPAYIAEIQAARRASKRTAASETKSKAKPER
jgi:hypothetical protein